MEGYKGFEENLKGGFERRVRKEGYEGFKGDHSYEVFSKLTTDDLTSIDTMSERDVDLTVCTAGNRASSHRSSRLIFHANFPA